MPREYVVLIAQSSTNLKAIAKKGGWTLLENTIKEFTELSSEDDMQMGRIPGLMVRKPGVVALGFADQA
jgi:hypothetical protein